MFDADALKAIKLCINGMKVVEVVTEYALDDETSELKVVKKKVNEKNVPPNIDLIKMVYSHYAETTVADYEKLTDEELLKEKQRLLKELKEEEDASTKGKNKNKV